MQLDSCRIIELPKIADARGNLTFIEGTRHVPFDIRRVYYTYDVPGGSERGGHAHRVLEQLIVAMSGSFDVELDDWVDEPDFHTANLDGQVLRAARLLDLPEDLARVWRTLPKPPPPDPADAPPPDAAEDLADSWPNTG